ncbi:MAG: efflux RND transporter periplasmic adaptor subunit [Thiohalomonadales bacterium]
MNSTRINIHHFTWHGSRSKRLLLIVLVFANCLFFATNIAAKDEKKSQSKRGSHVTPVVVAEATRQKLAPFSWVSGTVISRNDAKLATEVEGRLIQVAEVGQRMQKNQIVAKIDNTFVKLRIEEFSAAVQREKAQLKYYIQEGVRLQKLAKQNNAAQTRLEQTTADREVARNELNISEVRLLKAKEEMARHEIRAPFAGVISERLLRTGERAKIGDKIVRLIDSKSVEIQARAPLASVNFVTEGEELLINRGVRHEANIRAKIRALVPVGDERSRMMDLRLDFTAPLWRVGQSVRVALPTAVPREVLAVPRDALVLRRGGISIFRLKDDATVEKLSVSIGIASGDVIEVKNPSLKAGDKVIIRGGERLRPGQKVSVIETHTTKKIAGDVHVKNTTGAPTRTQ